MIFLSNYISLRAFLNSLELDMNNCTILRHPTTRRNHKFVYMDVQPDVDNVKAVCSKLRPNEKALVYFMTKETGHGLSRGIEANFYMQRTILRDWNKNAGVLFATSALGMGIDFKDAVLVVCL